MLDSAIIDVAIGIAFVFFLVSVLCSMIREGIEAWLKTRAAYLEHAIRELLHDRDGVRLARDFFDHPMIYALYAGEYVAGRRATLRGWERGHNLPSYIPSRSFALALMDLAARGPATDENSSPESAQLDFDSLRASVETLENPPVQRVLLAAIDSAQGDLDAVRANLEDWYQDAMERVSGWYKRSTQKIIFLIALVVVGVFNVNTLTIADHLYRDRALRSTLVASAENAEAGMTYAEASARLEGLRLPIGWSGGAGAATLGVWDSVIAPFLGLLITAFAATLGAPFWFDVLNKVVMFRATAKPKEARAGAPAPVQAHVPGVALQTAASASLAPALRSSLPPPREGDADGCASPIDDPTPDEDLPLARGGVAP